MKLRAELHVHLDGAVEPETLLEIDPSLTREEISARMAYDDLAYATLIRVRGLEWLLAPRFYVRTLVGKFAVFYVSDPALWQECERMAHELKTFRQM